MILLFQEAQTITIPNAIIGGLLLLILGWAFAIWFRSSGTRAAQSDQTERDEKQKLATLLEKIDKRLDDIEKELTETRMVVKPLWAKVQEQLSANLHHPHAKNREADELLDKLESLEINPKETERLKDLMDDRKNDKSVPPAERKSAAMMGYVMDLVIVEAAEIKTDADNFKAGVVLEKTVKSPVEKQSD